MPSLVSLHPSTLPATLRVTRALGAVLLLALGATAAEAQVYLSHTDDAAPVPKGSLRVRVTTGWARFDERFTPTGRRTLGDEISSDTFGARELPRLGAVESGIRTLANDPAFRLSLGRLDVLSDARIVTTPIALEYGVSRRLSVGVLVPVVQTRRSVSVRVNEDSMRRGNVGFVPIRLRQTAATQNNGVYLAYSRAADSLTTLLSRCPTAPTANGCAAVNANLADAQASRLLARRFADAVRDAFGVEPATALIAPRDSNLAKRIEAQRLDLNAKLRAYLGSAAGSSAGVFSATSDFSYIDLQGRNGSPGLLHSALGGLDSLQTTNRLVLGGVTIGAQFLVMDRFHADTSPPTGLQMRLVVGGAFRYETTFMDSVRKRGTIRTGDGSGVEARTAMDVISGRLGGTVAARYLHSFSQTFEMPLLGDPDAFYPVPQFGSASRTGGSVIGLDVTPRYRLGEWFAINGHYGLERVGAPTYRREVTCPGSPPGVCDFPFDPVSQTSQRVGIGLRYSTVDAYARGLVRTPVEVSYTHLQTFAGSDGAARLQRDQIQLRVFLRVRKRA